ncbi:hypothetical protein FACS1894190_11930 [Spirochaetia bacterium]|nr:hypothetical protein FACS1894190_11930 [Spirochaetia bacterium]
MLIMGILFLLITHTAKLVRCFFLVMEKRISFRFFCFVYIFTTVLNTIIPYKLGELLRLLIFIFLLKDIGMSLLVIFTERFFDSITLLLFLLPTGYMHGFTQPFVISSMCILALVFFMVYKAFPSISANINEFIILKKGQQLDITALKILDFADTIYNKEKIILKNKRNALVFLTAISWIFDFLAIIIVLAQTNSAIDIRSVTNFFYTITAGNMKDISLMYYKFSFFSLFIICITVSILSILNRRAVKNHAA